MAEANEMPLDSDDPREREWDRRMGLALQDVELPAGLEQRLLIRLAASDAQAMQAGAAASAELTTTAKQEHDTTTGTDRRHRRRWWLAGMIAVSTCAGIAFLGWRSFGPISESELRAQAITWGPQLSQHWLAMQGAAPAYPVSPRIRAFPTGFQMIATELDRHTHVYLLDRQRDRAYLYALRPQRYVAIGTSVCKMGGTAGWEFAAWKEGESLYILAVNSFEGERLDQFLPPSGLVQGREIDSVPADRWL